MNTVGKVVPVTGLKVQVNVDNRDDAITALRSLVERLESERTLFLYGAIGDIYNQDDRVGTWSVI